MSDYKWDGDMYQGTPDGEKKYDYYKVGDQETDGQASAGETTASAAADSGEGKKAAETAQETSYQNGERQGAASYQSSAQQTAGGSESTTGGNSFQGSAQGGPSYQGSAGQGTDGMGSPYQRNAGQGTGYQGAPYQGGGYQGSNYRAGQQGAPYQQQKAPKRKKVKKQGSGVGKKFGITISLALVFGLVAGLVFQGVNVIGNKYFNTGSQTNQQHIESTQLVPQTEASADGKSSSATKLTSSSVSAVAKSAMPSVVAITSISVQQIPDFFGYGTQEYQGVASGSGVIVGENDKELLIATNNHVVEDASQLSVCFIGDDVISPEQTQEALSSNGGLDTKGAVSASVKGTDPSNDLAVISVKKEDIPEDTMAQIKIAQIGNSDDLEVGEQVVAIGNALGYGQSVTAGYVSALNRQVNFENSNSSTMIQTDAAINPGNSGGALLNMQGQLIGINSAKEAANAVEGMGYAIPITTASPILDELMSRETREKVDEKDSAYLGIKVADLSEEAIQMYNMPQGAFVAEVTEGSAAEKAGLKQGDIITKLDGQTVTGRDDLLDKLQYYKAGESVEIVANRANEGEYVAKTMQITFDKRPAGE
ncbi:MAG: trypsin-like peptidase domain-containing protein [Blautia sp.]|jgi:serine protease Do